MDVLVVVESCFGNTARVAEAIADGLRSAGASVELTDAVTAPAPSGVDLLLVGAPTHNRGLPTVKSRAQAVERGGHSVESGIGEWLSGLPKQSGLRAVAFDTVVSRGFFAGSAAKRIERRLRRLGVDVHGQESFLVQGQPAHLVEGEAERAQAWGASWGAC